MPGRSRPCSVFAALRRFGVVAGGFSCWHCLLFSAATVLEHDDNRSVRQWPGALGLASRCRGSNSSPVVRWLHDPAWQVISLSALLRSFP